MFANVRLVRWLEPGQVEVEIRLRHPRNGIDFFFRAFLFRLSVAAAEFDSFIRNCPKSTFNPLYQGGNKQLWTRANTCED